MKIAVFAYNFPHKKTQDFLLRLFLEGFKIDMVLAANPVKLNLPPSNLRVKLRYVNLIHPQKICDRLKILYKIVDHNSPEVASLLRKNNIEVGIIAGARILKKHIIESVTKGIINFHPAFLPDIRGLDSFKWSIYYDIPLGVTAHFIDEKVDAGRIIKREEIPIYKDDTFTDLSLRLDETQVNMLPEVLEIIREKKLEDFPEVDLTKGRKNPPMSVEIEKIVKEKFEDYKKIFSKEN